MSRLQLDIPPSNNKNELTITPTLENYKSPLSPLPKPITPTHNTFQNTASNTPSKTAKAAQKGLVNLVKPVEPPVTYLEIFKFVIWSLMVIVTQLWRDISSFRFYRPLLSTDFMTHYFYIPVGRRDPRLVTSGPHNRMTIRSIPATTTRQYEEMEDLSVFPESETINCASNNYGGFSDLEPGTKEVIEAGLRDLPFCPPPKKLEDSVKTECADYMGFDEAFTAPSGFSTNVLAFATVAGVAASQGRQMVYLLDKDCHNSMFTGAFYNKGARAHKFKHNDIADLEFKLRMYKEQDPTALICVAIEGIYSMEGSISPGPAILALKKIYNFCLLVDEAHSFMALGSSGKGSFNHWEDSGYDCPLSEVDVMSCMFSKSVGCTGGFVLANGPFSKELRQQGAKLTSQGIEKLSTIVLLRILALLRKTKLIQHRMDLVQEKAAYVAHALSSAGCKILSSPGSAIICFPVGTVRQVALFHGEAMKMGMAIVGGVPPATPMWGCRVRICIFATTTWPDIYRLLTTTITISQKLKVRGVHPAVFDKTLLDKRDRPSEEAVTQGASVNSQLLDFIASLKSESTVAPIELGHRPEVVDAAVAGLNTYGVGPCSARWFYGSFDSFIHLEQRLARLYPSLVQQSAGRTRAMICGDAEITIGSTLSALTVPTASRKVTNTVFVYSKAPQGVLDGAGMQKETKAVTRKYYDAVDDIPDMLADIKKPTHLTFYFLTCNAQGGSVLSLPRLFSRSAFLAGKSCANITGITIMLDDRNGLGKIGPNKLGYLDLMESIYGAGFLAQTFARLGSKKSVRVIVAGGWYDSFGHQGGYVTGHADTVEALTWDAKAFFFSTPPMPLQACMTDKAIQMLQEKRDGGVVPGETEKGAVVEKVSEVGS